MIAGYNTQVTTVQVPDPAADANVLALVAPAAGARVLAAYAFTQTAVIADVTNYITASLLDGGADGTGTTVVATGGGASVSWAANGAKALTVTAANAGLDAGDHLLFKYDENGVVAPGVVGVIVHWSVGG